MREQLQKYGKRAIYVAGLVVVVEMVAVGFMWATANTSATDLGGGDEPIKYLQDSPPTPTPTGGCTPGDTGFLDPTSEAFDTGGDGDGFELNPTNAFADAGGNASNINGKDDRHRYYDYGISIPAGSAIHGIEVRLDAWVDPSTTLREICVRSSPGMVARPSKPSPGWIPMSTEPSSTR